MRSTTKKIRFHLLKLLFDTFFPGFGIVFGLVLSSAKVVFAAGPQDCWTGDPDEKLLRAMDKKLTKITQEQNALAEKAVQEGKSLNMNLPGSEQEQQKLISHIIENHLDDLDVDKRLRKVRHWDKQVDQSDSSFWLMVVDEITQFF